MEAKTQQLATLRVEINRLQERMHMLKAKLLMRFIEAGMQRSNILAAYWHLFRFGMAEPTGRHYSQQLEFVQTHMCADMYVNGIPGSEQLLDQWKLCQQLLPGLDAPNLKIQVFGAEQDCIVSSGIVYVHFSREAIAMIFPRLLAREDLVQLIIQRPAALPLRVSCHFDLKNQVQSMEVDINIFEGLRQSIASQVNVYEFYEALEDQFLPLHYEIFF
ncbi:hypothetical protein THRCLA_11788, partial [Thraustotheca clavata]